MRVLLPFFLSLVCASAAERLTCPATADTWVTIQGWDGARPDRAQAGKPHGQDPELIIQGRAAFALLTFDLSAARGVTIEKATLRVHRKSASLPLHTVGISTISGNGPWSEASANWFSQDGSRNWAYPGSDLVDVTFAKGGSLYSYQQVRDAGDGWYEFDIPPAMIAALVTGDQYGLMLSDEKGQTQTRHALSSRESGHPPVLLLDGTRFDKTAPAAVRSHKTASGILESSPAEARSLNRTTLRPGSVVLHFGSAGDDAGKGVAARYDLRYSTNPISAVNFTSASPAPRWSLDPLAPKPNAFSTANSIRDEVHSVVEELKPGAIYYFAARAIDEAGNAGPVSPLGRYRAYARTFPALPPAIKASTPTPAPTTETVKVWAFPETMKVNPKTAALLEATNFPDHRARNTVWDAATKTVKLTAARNEFVAFQIAVESAAPAGPIQLAVTKPLFTGVQLPAVFSSTGAVQLFREWFVPDDRNKGAAAPWYPDALLPLKGPVDLPSTDNPVPGQTVQPFFVDIFVPHHAPPGTHKGELAVRVAGANHPVHIQVEVLPLRLPDTLSFIVDLNGYSSVRAGTPGTPEYRAIEHAYHRLAHLHRTNLDILGYSQTGTTVPDHAPPLIGEGAATRVESWADWDAHFGPLLDASAFAGLPRAKIPVPAMYLPFFENWPGNIHKDYKHDDPLVPATEEEYTRLITRHALHSEPIEKAFSPQYQDRYTAVIAEFANHIGKQGWNNTRYFVYFNNKYYRKRPDLKGQGSSWWLLDEPNHRDDVLAINFLAHLTHMGLRNHPTVPIILRSDISRPEWMRDLLSGQVDLNCISARFTQRNRMLQDDRHRYGREYWNYASTNHPRDTNVAMRAWCWRVWLNGGDGLLPWNAVGGANAWDQAEPLTVFYPGAKFGQSEPFPSMRLKAYRRGQQDMEYLALLARKRGWDRDAVTHVLAQALDLSGGVKATSEEDAGTIRFDNISDAGMEELRLRVARALMAK